MSQAFSQFIDGSSLPVRLSVQGGWNANTNTPTLASGTGSIGHMYRVSVAGSTTLDGESSWLVGDDLFFDGSAWVKIDNNSSGGGGGEDLAATLALGNSTGGTNIVVSASDEVQGTDGSGSAGSDLSLRAGDGAGGTFAGGDLTLTPGAGSSGGADGSVLANGRLAVSGDLDANGNVHKRAEATGVTANTDLVSQVISNPNAGSNSQMVMFTAYIVAYAEPPGAPPAAVDTAAWKVEGVIVREVVTDTVLLPVAAVVTPLYNPNAPSWDVSVSADDPSKSLRITVTVDGFGSFPGAPPASFYGNVVYTPAGTPL